MQFITSGPDVPEVLLQSHEEGDVVFFCGAGISYPAGLPGFKGLVQGLYDQLNPAPSSVQQAAIKTKRYDTAIGLLESAIVGGRDAVRHELARILTPAALTPHATATHNALLTLSKTRDDGRLRLVTTNFDRLFEVEIERQGLEVERFRAPLLPVPKKRWDGLVYLHGLLTEKPTTSDLERLVASSGDFGLAYLTERWAARFVSEMFRYCTVCFVGYSLDDPVLRYMMDALAADRQRGESSPDMFAFGSYSKGKKAERDDEWRAKNVIPILYREGGNHRYLHKTLQAWAANFRDGARGKESIVVQHAGTLPLASTKEDDFVGRLLWALSDPSGLPARRFANFDPVPSLDWLEPFSERRFAFPDLSRFGVAPDAVQDDKLRYSLLNRPAPYTKAPWTSVTQWGAEVVQWDQPMFYLAHWLTRHLDDPKLLLWVAKGGGRLHPQFTLLIGSRLEELARIEREGKSDELARIRTSAPRAIPRPMLHTIWRLAIAGYLKTPDRTTGLYGWMARLPDGGVTVALLTEWRELLAPRIALREPFRWKDDTAEPDSGDRLKDLLNWEIVLASDHVHSAVNDIAASPAWRSTLPALLDETQRLLRDTLDVMRELGEADDRNDRAYWDLPSIARHWQNRGFRDWTVLIEVLRDAWLSVLERDPVHARLVVEDWHRQPYPTFQRLVLFAATNDGVASDSQWVDWLLCDGKWWLWSVETQRETMRLIVLRGTSLAAESRAVLEAAILAGPPRAMFREDIEADHWSELADRMMWLRLAKLASNGAALGGKAQGRLDEISAAYPQWQLANDERDEFSHWMSGTGDPGEQEWRRFEKVPRRRRQLVEWLRRAPSTEPWHENDWRGVCRERFATAACALYALARDDEWPAERWREALQAWSEEKYLRRSWRYLAPTLERMPNDKLLAIANSASWWLQAGAKVFEGHEAVFLNLCKRLLAMEHQGGIEDDRPVMHAINHPVGHVTQALLDMWFRRNPGDGEGLPADLKPVFTALCDTAIQQYRHARVLLAAHIIALFRVDRDWAARYVLPLFDWSRSKIEARGAWEGFLWSPRLYRPLVTAFKTAFLETARHYLELGEHGSQYAAILTYAALDPGDTFSISELREATGALPQRGLNEAALTLVQALEGAGEQREEYWNNRIQPYWQKIWPKSRALTSRSLAEQLARLCIAAGRDFPQALAAVHAWLQPVEHSHFIVHLLHESGLCAARPQEALKFLNSLIDNKGWPPGDLGACLEAIAQAKPDSVNEPAYQRLLVYARRSE